MERMVNRIFIIGNLGPKSGKFKSENSMKIIMQELQQHIHDVPIRFLANPNRSDFPERKLMDEFADNCIYVVENLNFYPEEFGYIENEAPIVEHKEEKIEEKKEEVSQPKDTKDSKGIKAASTSKKEKDDSKNNQVQSQQVFEEVQHTPIPVVHEEIVPKEELFNCYTIN